MPVPEVIIIISVGVTDPHDPHRLVDIGLVDIGSTAGTGTSAAAEATAAVPPPFGCRGGRRRNRGAS